MRIDPRSSIAGQSSIKMRKFLKKMHSLSWRIDVVRKEFRVSEEGAAQIVNDLLNLGYVERDKDISSEACWKTTLLGNAFGLASAAKPIRRKTAEGCLHEFMERVKQVNKDPYYLHKVTKVFLFGSYLSEADVVNDVDVAVALESKEPETKKRERIEMKRIEQVEKKGRRFPTIIDRVSWPQEEVILYLKSRSRVISLHRDSDPILGRVATQVIFDASEKKQANVNGSKQT